MRRSMKAALEHYKRALKRHLRLFVELDNIGASCIIVPQEQAYPFFAREMQLKGMQEVLGITAAELRKIYAELGPKYEVHLKYEQILRIKNQDT